MRNMHWRHEKPVEPEKAQFPLTVMGYCSYEPMLREQLLSGGFVRSARDRNYIPYQAGDLMFINLGTLTDPDIVLARVVLTFWEWLEGRGYYVPKYRVQTLTRRGNWSANWRYTFPGQVFRAYFTDNDGNVPRGLPTEVTADWLKYGQNQNGGPRVVRVKSA